MPTNTEIVAVIVDQLQKITPPGTAITPQSSIMGDLGLDSLTVMNFDISVPMDRIVEVQTITDLADALQALGAKANP